MNDETEIDIESDLVKWMIDFPIHEDFEEILSPIIIPLSLDEFWNAFYADDAPFDIEEF